MNTERRDTGTASILPLPELLPHGAHIGAGYVDGAWGRSTDEERPASGLSGTVRRFKKGERASDKPMALGWIKATYRDAIEYSGMRQPLEGAVMIGAFFGLMVVSGGVILGIGTLSLPFRHGFDYASWGFIVFDLLLGALVSAATVAFFAWITLTPLRQVWRAPRDLPIIFDRANRRVYRILRDVQPGIKGLFKPWPVKAVSYEWDLLDAEHDVQVMGSTATVSRVHRLVFVVRKSANDPTIIDHFEIGNGMAQGEEAIAPMWEHIRRFMEAHGPHLPTPGEALDARSDDKPSWWQACGEAGPFGSRYGWWWKNHPILTGFYHLLSLIGIAFTMYALIRMKGHPGAFMPFMATWIVISINWGHGTGRWLVAHTSRLFAWPAAVQAVVGSPTRIGAGWGR